MIAGARCRAAVGRSVALVPWPARLPVRGSTSPRRNSLPRSPQRIDLTDTVMLNVGHNNLDSPRCSAACQKRGPLPLTSLG